MINDNNYFQLRDLGDKLGFGVSWDNDARTVVITTEPTGQTENPANVATTADPYHAAAATGSPRPARRRTPRSTAGRCWMPQPVRAVMASAAAWVATDAARL